MSITVDKKASDELKSILSEVSLAVVLFFWILFFPFFPGIFVAV